MDFRTEQQNYRNYVSQVQRDNYRARYSGNRDYSSINVTDAVLNNLGDWDSGRKERDDLLDHCGDWPK